MIVIYLDMDGVLCNFDKAYRMFDPVKADRKKFRQSVMEHKIFETLEMMEDAHILLDQVNKINIMFKHIDVQILTSMGTFDEEQGKEAARQKTVWLEKNNISFKPNFVRSKLEKSLYAHEQTILIDDSIGCIEPFREKGGVAIHHTDALTSIHCLNHSLANIMSLAGQMAS